MSYQSCRWYDPYPKLAFALKLLYLAPGSLQVQASQELQKFLLENLGTGSAHATHELLGIQGHRWYDETAGTAKTVELIKNSPDGLKNRVADTLLEILSGKSA